LQALASRFDFVIVDTPPVLAVTDAVILSTRVDSVILVSRAGVTRRNQLKHAVLQLGEVNAHLAGVVLNQMKASSGGYYQYYYQSYYRSDKEVADEEATPSAAEDKRKSKQREARRRLMPEFLTRLLS
jgi:Mrp family chromosome partitioning ATPase